MTYPKQPETFADLVRVARRVIDRQSRSMTEDAIVLARWVLAEDERRGVAGIVAVVGGNRG